METRHLRGSSTTFCAFLDIRRAFAVARRAGALLRLLQRRSPGGELHLIDALVSYWTAAVRVASLVSDSWDVNDFIGQGTVWHLQSNMPVAFVAERRAMHLGVSKFCCMQMTLLSSAKTQQTCKEFQMQPLQGLELGGCVLVLVGTKCCTVCWPEARRLLPCNSTLPSNHGRPFAVTLI